MTLLIVAAIISAPAFIFVWWTCRAPEVVE